MKTALRICVFGLLTTMYGLVLGSFWAEYIGGSGQQEIVRASETVEYPVVR